MNKLTEFRRFLHQIPEIGRYEFKTQEYLMKTLKDMGHNPEVIFNTGVYVYLDYGNLETIMFRSDIDALPIDELNNIEFKSKHPGFMHACGHDGHMAMLLGFADYLKDKTNFNRNILLVFQPAEEGPGGAEEIVKTGIMKKLNVSEVYGIHLLPNYQEGTIISKSGPLMASITTLDVEVIGESAHVAMRGEGIDALFLGSLYYTEFLTKIYETMPEKNYVVKFGKMNSGTVRNIVSNNTKFEGTIRTFDDETKEKILDIMYRTKHKFQELYGVKININAIDLYPSVYNDNALYNKLKILISEDFPFVELENALLVSEDFAFYQKEAKGVFYFLGTKNEELGFTHLIHNNQFNFNEDVLAIGVATYIKLINSYK